MADRFFNYLVNRAYTYEYIEKPLLMKELKKKRFRITSGLIIAIIILLFYTGVAIMNYNITSGNMEKVTDVCNCKKSKR